MCGDFDMYEVKVPIVFFGTQGFSAHRDGHYLSLRVNNYTLRAPQTRDLYIISKVAIDP
jgi:hypothetical protein